MEKSVKIITLNIFHGRYRLKGVPLLGKYGVVGNLNKISEVLKRENPDIVLLQEIDNRSVMSGRFNHIEILSKFGDMPYYFIGEHVKMNVKMGIREVKLASYGTAILSKHEFKKTESRKLKTNVPILKKGFVFATINVPGIGSIDFVSVHFASLDLLPKKSRKKQAMELVNYIKVLNSKNPLIIGGDFNCDSDEEILKLMADSLKLRYFREEGVGTFPSRKPRKCIDWIMVSPELKIKDYYCAQGKISDHLAVVTEVVRNRR